MLERADQLVLDYLSKVADAAHGVLRPDQRLAFVQRLRARVDQERAGSADLRQVAKVIDRFGPPDRLVQREVRRLAAATGASGEATDTHGDAGARPGTPAGGGPVSRAGGAVSAEAFPGDAEGPTEVHPFVVDDVTERPPPPPRVRPVRSVPPGVAEGRRKARRVVIRQATRQAPFSGLRRIAMAGANPMATDGRDARTIVLDHRRETAGVLLLIVAGLLVPFRLPVIAIFPVPLLVWAVAALVVLAGAAWSIRDRLIGMAAPVLTYAVGGVVLGGARAEGTGVSELILSFHRVSGAMFILGTAAGVCWLAYRLLNPPPPPQKAWPGSPPGR